MTTATTVNGSTTMPAYAADLHVHTALSPCADRTMTPPAIVAAAQARGLALIAICDHNSAANVAAVQQAARQVDTGRDRAQAKPDQPTVVFAPAGANPKAASLTVLPGIEVTTCEGVHLLAYFPDLDAARQLEERLAATLPVADATYRATFSEQDVLAADGERLGDWPVALALPTGLGLTQVVHLVHEVGGLAVPAHIDRPAHGLLAKMGGLPAGLVVDAVEVSLIHAWSAEQINRRTLDSLADLPVLTSSDAHSPADVGAVHTTVHARLASFAELALALRRVDGRSVTHA